MHSRLWPLAWGVIFAAILIWSAWQPHDRFTWYLEVAPAVIGAIILCLTRKTYPLTPLVYLLILAHAAILMVGGHYTYAEVPLFDTIAQWTGSTRNNFDKLGHFAQGFVPAMIAREVIIRAKAVNSTRWLHFFVVCFCLALSAAYELIEWLVAVLSGSSAEAFLGTQGYVWDTQTDMAMALVGAILALVMLHRYHDQQLAQLYFKKQ